MTPLPQISAARVAQGRLLFISGQIALDDEGQVAHPGDAGAQAEMAFAQIGAILRSHGCDYADVLKLTTFVVDVRNLDAVREARSRVFSGAYSAATSVAVEALSRPGLLVEIEAVAEIGD